MKKITLIAVSNVAKIQNMKKSRPVGPLSYVGQKYALI